MSQLNDEEDEYSMDDDYFWQTHDDLIYIFSRERMVWTEDGML